MEDRMARGFELATKMSWQHVVEDYFLPSLSSTTKET
jgi:hypothetical protein